MIDWKWIHPKPCLKTLYQVKWLSSLPRMISDLVYFMSPSKATTHWLTVTDKSSHKWREAAPMVSRINCTPGLQAIWVPFILLSDSYVNWNTEHYSTIHDSPFASFSFYFQIDTLSPTAIKSSVFIFFWKKSCLTDLSTMEILEVNAHLKIMGYFQHMCVSWSLILENHAFFEHSIYSKHHGTQNFKNGFGRWREMLFLQTSRPLR